MRNGRPVFKDGLTGWEWYREVYLKSQRWEDLKAHKIIRTPNCERCGSDDRIQIHHKTYRNRGKDFFDELGDLETLCKSCHDKEHQ